MTSSRVDGSLLPGQLPGHAHDVLDVFEGLQRELDGQ
jgi:hypothetical protein